jgi:hypothetical protein
MYFLVDWIERQYWCFSPLISVCYIDKRMHLDERGTYWRVVWIALVMKHPVLVVEAGESRIHWSQGGQESALTRLKSKKGARVFSNLSLLRPKNGIVDAGRTPLRANLSHLKGAEFQVAFIRVF